MIKAIKTKQGIVWHTIHFFRGQRSPQRSTGKSSQREAEKIDRERQLVFEREITEKLSGKPALPPLSIDLMAQWKKLESSDKELNQQYATTDTERYFRSLKQYDWPFEKILVEHRWAYVRMRRAQITKLGKPPYYRSLKRELFFLGWGLKKAKKLGYKIEVDLEMPDLPSEARHEKRRGHLLSPGDFAKWRAHLPPIQADQALVQVLTGLRWGELRKMDLAYVRTDTLAPTPGIVAYIDLPRSVCDRERTLALTQAAYDALRRILPLPTKQQHHTYRAAAKAAGLSRAPHERDLRTTFATIAAAFGGDAKGVDLAMGHVDGGSAQRYQQIFDQRLAKIALIIAERFHPISPDLSTQGTCPTCKQKWNGDLQVRKV